MFWSGVWWVNKSKLIAYSHIAIQRLHLAAKLRCLGMATVSFAGCTVAIEKGTLDISVSRHYVPILVKFSPRTSQRISWR